MRQKQVLHLCVVACLLISIVKVHNPARLVMIKAVWNCTACLIGPNTQG